MTANLNRNQQRLLERYNRQEQLIVPLSIRGRMRCPACKGERRIAHVEFQFNHEEPQLLLEIVCINTRCRITNGRPKNITFLLQELDDDGNMIKNGGTSITSSLDKLIKDNNVSLKSSKDAEPNFFEDLVGIKGIGRKIASKIIQAGYSPNSIKNARTSELQKLGMTTKQANLIIDAFQ